MKEITYDDLCRMKLHEVLWKDRFSVLRVPGGWIYTLPLYSNEYYTALSSCFVPYPNVNSARTEGAEETEEYGHLRRDAERYQTKIANDNR